MKYKLKVTWFNLANDLQEIKFQKYHDCQPCAEMEAKRILLQYPLIKEVEIYHLHQTIKR